jgi:arsenite methyltransferase
MATDQIDPTAVREQVRERYAAVASSVLAEQTTGCCAPAGAEAGGSAAQCCGETVVEDWVGAGLYGEAERAELPSGAVAASLGCGNPLMVADLRPGETVLDLGSGGGIDVLLSARRVGPTGKAFGLDMGEEMLELARRNAAQAGATNAKFLRGQMEDIPLPDGSVDVVISNCVINLSVDKPSVFASMYRVLRPGGRIGISDVVAEDRLSPQERAERGGWVGCIAGALSVTEYRHGLVDAGFTGVEIVFTQQAAHGIHSAIVRASKPSA